MLWQVTVPLKLKQQGRLGKLQCHVMWIVSWCVEWCDVWAASVGQSWGCASRSGGSNRQASV